MGTDLFGYRLTYLNNGNISRQQWRHAGATENASYDYTYDGLNRLTSATSADNKYSVSNLTYDLNGNIRTLSRRGPTAISETGTITFGVMDDLTYNYDPSRRSRNSIRGNILQVVREHESAALDYGFKANNQHKGTFFNYDDNGNVKKDLAKGIESIRYNHLNLPERIIKGNDTLLYLYDANGAKLKKTMGSSTTGYTASTVYKNDTLELIHTPEGYIEPIGESYRYIYRIKDHLGNTRVSFTQGSGTTTTTLIQSQDYYPFGMEQIKERSITNSTNLGEQYKFNGVEYNETLDLNLYEMDFRQYDPTIGRFLSVDPLAEEREWIVPYNFAQNNPILRVDPTGLLDWIYDKDKGNMLGMKV